VGLRVPEQLRIASHKGEYLVRFAADLGWMGAWLDTEPHCLVDALVARLHAEALRPLLAHPRTILIEATESNKSIEQIVEVMRRLIEQKLRRDHVVIGIGGGIIQDITCFAASTLLRGVPWKFVPTTLLAQADSCIGSKSSVNLGTAKNMLGTFYPPREVVIDGRFLPTLEERDLRSGIGEIIKVHAIESPVAFDRLALDYERLGSDPALLRGYIERALAIKQRFIERDEFDTGVRNVFNYGHSFGHAIESATEFAVPHGIAVTMGMEIANHVAAQRGLLPWTHHARMRALLRRNYRGFERVPIPVAGVSAALLKDKKNTSAQLVLILPTGAEAAVQRTPVNNDAGFQEQLAAALGQLYS
jgi:3-dehydroquinate synthase